MRYITDTRRRNESGSNEERKFKIPVGYILIFMVGCAMIAMGFMIIGMGSSSNKSEEEEIDIIQTTAQLSGGRNGYVIEASNYGVSVDVKTLPISITGGKEYFGFRFFEKDRIPITIRRSSKGVKVILDDGTTVQNY